MTLPEWIELLFFPSDDMQLKAGVSVRGLRPELVVAIGVAGWVFSAAGHELTVTSACEGKHSKGSKHYSGLAVDLRTRDIPGGPEGIAATSLAVDLREALGNEFDVVVEKTHIHVEFHPKEPL